MASIWDFLDSLPKRGDVTPEELARRRQGYADLYQGGLLAGNRDQMPLSVQGAQATQDFMPVIGDALALGEAGEALSRGELAAAGLLGTAGIIGLFPGVGDALAKPVMAAGRRAADIARRIEVDPNALGSMGGNIRLRPESVTPAQEVAGLLLSGRADEVTDEMLAKFTPKDEMEMFDLYQRGATGMDLPMDEASRMARAREMGFDVAKPRYHGSDLSLSYLDPDMGAGERYRTGVFSTDNPDVADSYVSKSGGTIYPMTTRRNDGGSTINAAGANWNKIPPSAPARIAGSALEQEFPELFGDVSTTAYDVAPSLYDDLFNSGASTNALAREKRFAGDSNITFENLVDRGPNIKRYLGETPEMQKARELSASQPSEVRVDFYGNQIRAPFARFDPRLAHLRNLSASVGGLGLLSSMMPQEEQY
jgi:hypothetical protein